MKHWYNRSSVLGAKQKHMTYDKKKCTDHVIMWYYTDDKANTIIIYP